MATLDNSSNSRIDNPMGGMPQSCTEDWRKIAWQGCAANIAASYSDDQSALEKYQSTFAAKSKVCGGSSQAADLVKMSSKQVAAIFDSGKMYSTSEAWCAATVDEIGVTKGYFPNSTEKSAYPIDPSLEEVSKTPLEKSLSDKVADKKATYIQLAKNNIRQNSNGTASVVALTFSVWKKIPVLCGIAMRGPSSLGSYRQFALFQDNGDLKIYKDPITAGSQAICARQYEDADVTDVDRELMKAELIPSEFQWVYPRG